MSWRCRSSLAVAALALASPAQAQNCEPDPSWPLVDPARGAEVLVRVNAHRASIGRLPLSLSPSLVRAAEWKARHMAATGFFSHSDPDGRTAFGRMDDCGYPFQGRGENIAFGYTTPATVVTAWLGSPGHRAAIENAGFIVTGVGVAFGIGGWNWVQDFGSTLERGPPPPTPPVDEWPPLSGARRGGNHWLQFM